ncbi:hypothetical protein DY000_02007764 [Brassica cretica]|uniref:Uncharacterized protein n=1 Tax=Brassica cretica TaxID=69181 RepID=A0ABQ7C2J2_BRACR|nr:hypothetical protein DY000_02007764 [Brassica cretica]
MMTVIRSSSVTMASPPMLLSYQRIIRSFCGDGTNVTPHNPDMETARSWGRKRTRIYYNEVDKSHFSCLHLSLAYLKTLAFGKDAYNKNRIPSEVTKVLNPVRLIHRCLHNYVEGEENTPTEEMRKICLFLYRSTESDSFKLLREIHCWISEVTLILLGLSHVPPLPLQRSDALAKGIELLFFIQSYPGN